MLLSRRLTKAAQLFPGLVLFDHDCTRMPCYVPCSRVTALSGGFQNFQHGKQDFAISMCVYIVGDCMRKMNGPGCLDL